MQQLTRFDVPDSRLVDDLVPSCNVGQRRHGQTTSLIVLHYTGMATARAAIGWLTNPISKVSCHYVIDEAGRITQLVSEASRAWHAGQSFWRGVSDVNSASVGIEIQNPGHADGYPPFPDAQMEAIAALCTDIAARHDIKPENILAHSDVAPGRKIDPGEKFNWGLLFRCGVGHWVEPTPLDTYPDTEPGTAMDGAMANALDLLRGYGYGLEVAGDHWRVDDRSGVDRDTAAIVLRAFQRHFRPARVDGKLDASTLDTLERLIASQPSSLALPREAAPTPALSSLNSSPALTPPKLTADLPQGL